MRFICRGCLPCAHSASIKMRHLLSDAPQGAFWMLSALCVCVCVFVCLCLQRPVCVCVYGVWYLCVCVCSPFSPEVFHLQFFFYKGLPFCVPAPAAIPAKRGKRHISVRPLPYETASRCQESASLINLSRPAPSGFS